VKPFECVGTREEAQAALYLSKKREPALFQTGLAAQFWAEVQPLRSEAEWQSLIAKLLS
jgi:hypothetical protein